MNGRLLEDRKIDRTLELIAAAGEGRADVVISLSEDGADVNAKNRKGWTPLLEASMNGCGDVVKLLLEKNAEGKEKALDVAIICGHNQIVEILIDNGVSEEAKRYALWLARDYHKTDMEKLLNEKGIHDNPLGINPNKFDMETRKRILWELFRELHRIGKEKDAKKNEDDGKNQE